MREKANMGQHQANQTDLRKQVINKSAEPGFNGHGSAEEQYRAIGVPGDKVAGPVSEPASARDEPIQSAEIRKTLKVDHNWYRELFYSAPDPYIVTDAKGTILEANREALALFGADSQAILGTPLVHFFPEEGGREFRNLIHNSTHSAKTQHWDSRVRNLNSELVDVAVRVNRVEGKPGVLSWLIQNVAFVPDTANRKASEQEVKEYRHNLELLVRQRTAELAGLNAQLEQEIESRKRAEKILSVRNRLLKIMGDAESRNEYLDEVLEEIRHWSGCRCVGIRVLNEKGAIPYEARTGFSEEFWRSENSLVLGRDNCVCTRIVTGKPEPQDRVCMTPGGSFRCGDTLAFASCLSEPEMADFRGVCIKTGFSSVALIPLRHRDRTIGAIHLADERRGMLTDQLMEVLESGAPLIGEAILKFDTREDLRQSYGAQRAIDSILQMALADCDLQTIMEKSLEAVLAVPGLPLESAGSVCLVEEGSRRLVLKARQGRHVEAGEPCGKSCPGECRCRAAECNGAILHGAAEGPIPCGKSMLPHGYCCIPILASGKMLGVMHATLKQGRALDTKTRDFLIAASNALAGVIERKHIERELSFYVSRLERSNRDLEHFAYTASHDLSEPLRKIRAFANLIFEKIRDSSTEDVLDRFQRIQSAAARMHTLLDDLLSYSRVSTRQIPFRPVDLRLVAENAISDLWVSLEKTDGRVELGDLPQIEADSTQMRQLFQNLIANALKFHADTPPVVRLHGTCRGKNCTIYVEDNGIGFDEKYLGCIFDPFQRLHGRNEYEGTGMGLAICRRIVERHRGSITARSAPSQGSTFIITLPRQQEKENNEEID